MKPLTLYVEPLPDCPNSVRVVDEQQVLGTLIRETRRLLQHINSALTGADPDQRNATMRVSNEPFAGANLLLVYVGDSPWSIWHSYQVFRLRAGKANRKPYETFADGSPIRCLDFCRKVLPRVFAGKTPQHIYVQLV
jgi:hypothetical protein